MSFNKIRLDQIIDFNPRRIIKKGAIASYVEMAGIPEGNRDISYTFQKEFNGSGSKFRNGDTLFARITPCLENGKTAKVNCLKKNEVAHGSTEFIVFSAKEPAFDEDFIYYLCRWPKFREFAKSRMEGTSGRQRVDWKVLAESEWELPGKEERKEIGFLLKQIDDKISNNNRINHTLEEIVKALFKSWFVDFEPVKAKVQARTLGVNPQLAAMMAISGKTEEAIHQLPEEIQKELAKIADDFPDDFEESELGKIPKGWKVKSLYDTAEYINGSAFKSSDFCEKQVGLPIIKIVELKTGISEQTKYTNKYVPEKYMIDNNSMLYSWSGSPETSLEVFKWFGGEGWLNQHIFKINTQSAEQKVFVYFLLKYLRRTLVEIAKNKQTTGLGHVTVADMKRIKVVVPGKVINKLIKSKIVPLFDLSSNCMNQNSVLAKERDSLIPKLLLGEINV